MVRLLDIEVVTADSSEDAEKRLEKDNDFDLIVIDVKKDYDSYESVNFIGELRGNSDTIIRKLPVILYSKSNPGLLPEVAGPA